MSICYVLRDDSKATNDVFYFSIEDNSKFFYLNIHPPLLCSRHTRFEMSLCCRILTLLLTTKQTVPVDNKGAFQKNDFTQVLCAEENKRNAMCRLLRKIFYCR